MSGRVPLGGRVLVGTLAGVVLAGCGASTHHSERSRPVVVSRTPVTTTARVSTPAPPPALSALQRALSAELAAAGPASGAVVYDITAAKQLFSLRATVSRPPASVEKLYTTVAALKELGPGAQLQTTVLGSGRLVPGGIYEGNLYLRGGGDPTFGDGAFNQVWEEGYGPTAAQLVAQLRGAGIRRVTGRVIGDASLFDPLPGAPNSGFAPDVPDLGGELAALTYDHGATAGRLSPGAFAARQLVRTMRGSGISARAAAFTAPTPAGARLLASVSSPPVAVLVRLMDVPSDDFFAEMLTKQLGVRFGGAGSTVAGASVIASAVDGFGVYPTIVDGSGLSREDSSSPEQVLDLLRAVWGTPLGHLLQASLPLVGVSGTARRIPVPAADQGRCAVKTGSLNDVSNLAGYCESRGGHVLGFAVFVDGPNNTRGFALIGRIVAAIVGY